MAGGERDADRLYESSSKKRMKKKEQELRNALNLQKKNRKISKLFACDMLDSPSVIESSASSAMLDVKREESDLFPQDVNAKKI